MKPKVFLAQYLVIAGMMSLSFMSAPAHAKPTSLIRQSAPFAASYDFVNSSGAHCKVKLWSNGKGCYRKETEIPFSKIDGLTDVVIDDYSKGKSFVVSPEFQVVEVQPLTDLCLPLTAHELKTDYKATYAGDKTICSHACSGWRYLKGGVWHEVWISKDLGWYLEFKRRRNGRELVCRADSVSQTAQPDKLFHPPRASEYKYVSSSNH